MWDVELCSCVSLTQDRLSVQQCRQAAVQAARQLLLPWFQFLQGGMCSSPCRAGQEPGAVPVFEAFQGCRKPGERRARSGNAFKALTTWST